MSDYFEFILELSLTLLYYLLLFFGGWYEWW